MLHPPHAQKYAWGKSGNESVVASLKAAGDKSYQVKSEDTYAEMWVGTHPSGPCHLMTTSGNLDVLLKVAIYSSCIQMYSTTGESMHRASREDDRRLEFGQKGCLLRD